jgi:Zn-dependent protease
VTAGETHRRRSRPALERMLFGLAGTVVLIGAALSALVSPWFLLLIAFAGVNQWAYVLAGDCPASLILRRVAGLESRCPQ